MRLAFPTFAQLKQVWREDFLGQRGFFLPPKYDMPLGQEVELDVEVGGEKWGRARLVPVWKNQHGPQSEHLPLGLFLRLLSAEDGVEQRLGELTATGEAG